LRSGPELVQVHLDAVALLDQLAGVGVLGEALDAQQSIFTKPWSETA
jgi:hypothetical protein